MYYILDKNNKPLKSNNVEWAKWIQIYAEKARVGNDRVNDVLISTVFLGLDHSYGSDKPILWETMIFEGEEDAYQKRYTSFEDAEIGHQEAVDLVKQIR